MEIEALIRKMIMAYSELPPRMTAHPHDLVWRMSQKTAKDIVKRYSGYDHTPLFGDSFMGIPVEYIESTEVLLAIKVVSDGN